MGLVIGENNLLFHPLHSGGGFRVDGAGGFSNINMGFTPSANVLHHMNVQVDASTGLFDITITDGNNANNIFTTSFTNLASVGGDIGLHRYGHGGGIGLYDNFVIANTVNSVSEPFSVFLFGAGFIGLFFYRKKNT